MESSSRLRVKYLVLDLLFCMSCVFVVWRETETEFAKFIERNGTGAHPLKDLVFVAARERDLGVSSSSPFLLRDVKRAGCSSA